MTIYGNSIWEWIIFFCAIIVAGKYADYMAERQMRGKIFITSAEPYAMEKIKRRYAMGHFGLAIAVETIVFAYLYKAYKEAVGFVGNNWQWIVGGFIGIIGIGLFISSISKKEENIEEGDENVNVPRDKTKRYVSIGLIAIGAGLFISGMMGDSSKPSTTNNPTTQIAQNTNTNSTQSYNQSQKRENRTPTASTNNQINRSSDSNNNNVDLSTYISRKDQFDREISSLANEINSYLQSHSNLRNQYNMRSRGENLSISIRRMKTELQNASTSNTAVKRKLIEVLEAEIGRVEGLVEGVNASMNGGDYAPGFKRGGDAYDRFEEANEALNKMLR